MAVLLSGFSYRTAGPRLIDFGGELTPGLGAEVQRLNRLGNRFAIELELPPVREEPEGRILAAKLRLAKTQGALFAFPQPGLAIGAPGNPVVDGAVTGGTSLPLRGLTPHYAIRFGQFLSIINGGRRYLYSAAAAATADASGEAIVTIDPLLRRELADGDVVELAKPMIEGLLATGDLPWGIMLAPFLELGFSITEAA